MKLSEFYVLWFLLVMLFVVFTARLSWQMHLFLFGIGCLITYHLINSKGPM